MEGIDAAEDFVIEKRPGLEAQIGSLMEETNFNNYGRNSHEDANGLEVEFHEDNETRDTVTPLPRSTNVDHSASRPVKSRGSGDQYFRDEIDMNEIDDPLTRSQMEKIQMGQQLLMAVNNINIDHVTSLLKQGVDPNFQNVFGTSSLHTASKHGWESIVQLLLDGGANVNICDSRKVSPLCIALINRQYDVAKILLSAGADASVAVQTLSDVLQGVKDYALEALVEENMLINAPNIIRTCFKLSSQFELLSKRQEERKFFYSNLRDRCRDLPVNLLAACNGMWDVRRLLAEATGILGMAIKYDQTLFVAHPYCQEFIKEIWLGQFIDVYGYRLFILLFKQLMFPVLFPYYLFLFAIQTPKRILFSKLGDYIRLCHTPVVKFLGHMMSYVAFLILVISVSATRSTLVPNALEITLAIWVISLISEELREMYQTPNRIYFASSWNLLDVVNQCIYASVIVMRAVIFFDRKNRSETDELLFASNICLAFAGFLSCTRFLNVLEAHHLLGPLQISIRQILSNLFMFLAILVVFMFAFAVGTTKVFEHLEDIPDNDEIIEAFGSFPASLRTMFWGIFGLIEPDVFTLDGKWAVQMQIFGEIFFGGYMVLVFVLLINLLIAIITNTYQRIVDNSDVVWKFARARLVREYINYPAVPAPFNLILEPLEKVVRLCGLSVHSIVRIQTGHSSSDQAEEDLQLRKLTSKLVRRFQTQQSSVDNADVISMRTHNDNDVNDTTTNHELRSLLLSLMEKVDSLEKKISSS